MATRQTPQALHLDEVTFSYGATTVVRDLSQEWGTGVNVLLGLNGAGKTTLLRLVATVLVPAAGRISYGDLGSAADLRRVIGYQPQTAQWKPRMSVREFLLYFAWCRGVPRRRQGGQVDAALDAVDLQDLAGTRVGALSGGQYRRLLLAQALVHDPPVVVLDEPAVGLDPSQRARFRETVARLGAERVVVLSTHVLEDVAEIADRISVLHGGRIVFDGTPDELARRGLSSDDRSRRMEEGFVRLVSAEVVV